MKQEQLILIKKVRFKKKNLLKIQPINLVIVLDIQYENLKNIKRLEQKLLFIKIPINKTQLLFQTKYYDFSIKDYWELN